MGHGSENPRYNLRQISLRVPGVIVVGMLAGAGMAPRIARAQDAPSADLATVVVDSDQETARGPVDGYIATRSAVGSLADIPIIETPRAVSVVTREQMNDRDAQNITEAVRYTAGVTTGDYGYDPRFDSIVIRGFDVTERGDYRDGLRQGAGSFAYFRTEPYGLERIDILKGPAGVLYGDSQPGGIIDRISRMPTEKTFLETSVWGGTDNLLQGGVDMGGKLNQDGTLLYRFTAMGRVGEIDNGAPNNAGYIAPVITYKPDADTTFTAFANYLDFKLPSNMAYIFYGTTMTNVPAAPGSYNSTSQQQSQVGYFFDHRFDDTWSIHQGVRYGHIDLDARYLDYSVATFPVVDRYSVNYKENLDTLSADTRGEARVTTGPVNHTVSFGVDYLGTFYQSYYGFGAAPGLDMRFPNVELPVATPYAMPYTDVGANQIGIYAIDQMKFGNWRFNLGGRFDWLDRYIDPADANAVTMFDLVPGHRADNAFSWQTGLLYLFDNGVAPYLSYSTSFQAANAQDQNGGLLEPSTGEQYEAGIKYQPPGGRSFITASVYQITQSNYAVQFGNQLFYTAVGGIRVRGFELEALAELMPGLDVTAAYTYLDAVITQGADFTTNGNGVPGRPENTLALWARYQVPDGPLRGVMGGVGVRLQSGTWGDEANLYRNPAQGLVDAMVGYQKDNFRFQVNATNIADERYAIMNGGFMYWSEGRRVVAQAAYRW